MNSNSMDYFVSDLHIGHDKEFLWGARGFSSIEDHDTAILKNWNSIVNPNDNVYILGDLCMSGNEKEWDRIFKALNGNKFFVHGNHDTVNKINKYTKDYNIKDLGLVHIYKYNKKWQFYLSHYPTLVANNEKEKRFWNLSGHTHNKNPFQWGTGCVYNVALDAHGCIPVSIEKIIKDIENYYQKLIKGAF